MFELPPLLQYPIILGLLGLLSFPFSLIFGSGSLGDTMGVPSERGAPPAKEAAAPKAIKAPTAQDPSNNIAPKELQINRKSCDVFPYSLTPTCTVCPFAAWSFVLSRACYARVSACVSLCAFLFLFLRWAALHLTLNVRPLVQDPDVGNKGILKNLDKYTNTDWKAKAGLNEDGTPAKKAAPANKGAPAPAAEAEEE